MRLRLEMMRRLSRDTLVSLGSLIAAVAVTVPIVRAVDAPYADVAAVRVRVAAVEARVDELRNRQDQADDKADARWMRVLDDLSQIKQRLGIVESRPQK